MITEQSTQKLLLYLLKDFSNTHTITTLAKELNLSRVGTWKILKRLEQEKYLLLRPIGTGKTSTYTIHLHWENPLVEKIIAFYLLEEALHQKRWQINFSKLENITDFVILFGSILHSPKEANDIDIVGITIKNNFIKIQTAIDLIQKTQLKSIHSINFTPREFKSELRNDNKAFINAIKKGIILFGQEKFVKFMKEITT